MPSFIRKITASFFINLKILKNTETVVKAFDHSESISTNNNDFFEKGDNKATRGRLFLSH